MKRIFIGGTGRSGTTILQHAMYRHHETYTLPLETKFLVEDGGLCDLVDGLTYNFSITHAQGAVRRFDDLMRFHLAERNRNNLGLEFTIPEVFGIAHYYNALDQFIDTITHGRYIEKEALGRFSKALYPSEIASRVNSIPKYFSDRDTLLATCREFTRALFDNKAIAAERSCWVEKTPSNLLKISFLHELYPDSIFIHIKRDPRSVAYSLLKQSWAPDNIVDAANYMRGTYEKWLKLRNKLPSSTLKNYHEVKLEDLINNPDELLNSLVRKCGLSDYDNNALDLVRASIQSYMGGDINDAGLIDRKLNAWKFDLSKEEIDMLNHIYGDIIEAMGYGSSGKSWLEKLAGFIR
ncbi:MAG: sulfotransferase [Gallionella sp.]|jgi:hypothetical protein|nr:sulfotransferase [Gallionella sp.]